jgi:hypothetical protein
MSIEARIRELDTRHARLSDQIDDAGKHPSMDSLELSALKKEKLRLKEEIAELRRRH